MAAERPDPDALLARVEREQARARRGRLKIFFGAAAGVGKTYAMLQAARERRAEGVDVVVGVVETHGRKETAALLEGLEVLPLRTVEYHGTVVGEFDLDGALKRRPSVILVDELAHTNAAGSRHPKRWQDVEELLRAGIDVYTTLNVQHLESLNDDVGQIAGIRVWETVPDTVFEAADEVELIDLPPDELLVRLKEGKVYVPQQAELAAENFFRKGNLIALRELALRQTAARVDAQMQDYREDHTIREIWQVGERILVCIGPNPMAERLIRAGKRLAASLKAEWLVVYVETPALQRLPAERRDAVLRMLRLAEQLGAETVTVSAPDMSEAIIDLAKTRNVTKIVMGKPQRRGWKRWLLGSVVDTIIAEAHNISIYLLGSPPGEDRGKESPPAPLPGLSAQPDRGGVAAYRGYLGAAAVTFLCTLAAKAMFGRFEPTNLVMVYLLGVIFVATRYGRGPSILASILGVLAFDFFFVVPYYTFSVADTQYLFTFAVMLSVALVTANLMANVRSQAKVAAHRERRATVLYAMSKELAASRSEAEIVQIAVRQIETEFGGRAVLLFPDESGRIGYPVSPLAEDFLPGIDMSVAQWVFDHNEMAGQGTNTLPAAGGVYIPLTGAEKTIGVLVMKPVNLRRVFLPEQQKLLQTFVNLIVQAIERVRLAEQARINQVRMESERLRNSLLSSISHDLRTPLATIVGSASTLVEGDYALEPEDRRELCRAIYDEARRMASLVNNILDMAWFDAGVVKLHLQWHILEEIVGTVLTRLQKQLERRSVTVRLPRDAPFVYVDSVMLEQVLANLLENAIRYTPENSPIEIAAEATPFTMTITVSDRGPGIPKGQEELIFEKFHRVHREGPQSGVGLGLAICRAIVEAHGGYIRARNRTGGGAVFTIVLPLRESPPQIEPEAEPAE
ncbi:MULTISPECIES: sensor histidine kinase [Methylococcus]|uniref:histidine kinase n=1 Tax=Methylococcus capsulatus TaxID=414 RepID=A0ABZ2F6B6_METCP|nr:MULTISPECIES: sensor histidine kinase KdpD [Methylococcus]MDF9392278.1 sensor histidine kinase KdpD [Methylococcus capsulatus]